YAGGAEGSYTPIGRLGHLGRARNAPANLVGQAAEILFHRRGAHYLRQNLRRGLGAGRDFCGRAPGRALNGQHGTSERARLGGGEWGSDRGAWNKETKEQRSDENRAVNHQWAPLTQISRAFVRTRCVRGRIITQRSANFSTKRIITKWYSKFRIIYR